MPQALSDDLAKRIKMLKKEFEIPACTNIRHDPLRHWFTFHSIRDDCKFLENQVYTMLMLQYANPVKPRKLLSIHVYLNCMQGLK